MPGLAYTRSMRNKQNKSWMAACAVVVIVAFGSACTTTGSNFRRPEAPKTRTFTQSVQLFKTDDRYLLERGTPLLITTPTGPQGPVVFYGADDEGQVLTAYGQDGLLQDFPMADIQHIQVIKDGKVGHGLGLGSLAGLALGMIGGLLVPSGKGGDWDYDNPDMSGLAVLGGGLIGVGVGMVSGGVVGGVMSIDKDFPMGKTAWQIQTRPTPIPAPQEPTKTEHNASAQ